MKIIFAGTPRFAVPSLSAVINEGHDIPVVYTQPDRAAGRGRQPAPSPIKQFALDQNLPVRQPLALGAEEAEHIRSTGCDLLVVVAYGMILPQDVLDAPQRGCINVHASILPRWRGAAPIQRAIEAGDKNTGISIMLMAAGLDTGPVLDSISTRIEDSDTTAAVYGRLADMGAQILVRTVADIANKISGAVEQDDALACYARKIQKREAELDWAESAVVLQRRIRAFNPWPVCQTTHRGSRIRIWEARVVDGASESASPGKVEKVDDNEVVVSCGIGRLGLRRLQREGGKPLPAGAFLRGYDIAAGDILGTLKNTSGGAGDVSAG